MKQFVNNTNPLMKGPVRDKNGVWSAPTTCAVPQDNDKIIDYTRKSWKKMKRK